MSLIRQVVSALARAAGRSDVYKDANIYSEYHLCALQYQQLVSELVTPVMSLATLSVAEVKLIATPATVAPSLCKLVGSTLTASPASAYDLSKAET